VPSHRSTGAYRLLEVPRVYQRLQQLVRGRDARERYVREFIRPAPRMRILDIGCGTGDILEDLPADVDYTGYDLNPRYIERAREQHGHRARFFCAKVGEAADDEQGHFDLVLATALLHHLDDAAATDLAWAARRQLGPGGVFVTLDAVFHTGQHPVARAMAKLDRGGAVRSPEAYRALLEPAFPEIETVLTTDLMPIPYSHFVMRATAPGDAAPAA
jgi:SAM-dependent methyltransferase